MANDFTWVDRGLDSLGFKLDLSPTEIPFACRPDGDQPLSVNMLMHKASSLFDIKLGSVMSKADHGGRWTAEIGFFAGSSVVSQKTTLPGLTGVSTEDYMKLFVDNAMLDVARVWDATFVEGAFEYVITRDGRTFKAADETLTGMKATDVAKVMRWVFKAEGLTKREVVSVYVSYIAKDSLFVSYFPVYGNRLPHPTKGHVRGRLMIPCLDRVIFNADGSTTFEHYASAALMGWMPNFILNSYIGRKKFLEGASEEADNLLDLLSKKGDLGGKFASIPLQDGTSCCELLLLLHI